MGKVEQSVSRNSGVRRQWIVYGRLKLFSRVTNCLFVVPLSFCWQNQYHSVYLIDIKSTLLRSH